MGNCSFIGVVQDGSHVPPLGVTDLIAGTWGSAQLITGTTSGSSSGAISCRRDGEGVVAGQRPNGLGYRAFMVERTGGTCGAASDIPGMSTPSRGDSFIHELSRS